MSYADIHVNTGRLDDLVPSPVDEMSFDFMTHNSHEDNGYGSVVSPMDFSDPEPEQEEPIPVPSKPSPPPPKKNAPRQTKSQNKEEPIATLKSSSTVPKRHAKEFLPVIDPEEIAENDDIRFTAKHLGVEINGTGAVLKFFWHCKRRKGNSGEPIRKLITHTQWKTSELWKEMGALKKDIVEDKDLREDLIESYGKEMYDRILALIDKLSKDNELGARFITYTAKRSKAPPEPAPKKQVVPPKPQQVTLVPVPQKKTPPKSKSKATGESKATKRKDREEEHEEKKDTEKVEPAAKKPKQDDPKPLEVPPTVILFHEPPVAAAPEPVHVEPVIMEPPKQPDPVVVTVPAPVPVTQPPPEEIREVGVARKDLPSLQNDFPRMMGIERDDMEFRMLQERMLDEVYGNKRRDDPRDGRSYKKRSVIRNGREMTIDYFTDLMDPFWYEMNKLSDNADYLESVRVGKRILRDLLQ